MKINRFITLLILGQLGLTIPKQVDANEFLDPEVTLATVDQTGTFDTLLDDFSQDTLDPTQSFIQQIGDVARSIAHENDLYASVMIAQAILESGSGTSQLAIEPNFNIFGIKGSKGGRSVCLETFEDTGNSEMISIQSDFRVYDSYEGSLKDYCELLTGGLVNDVLYYDGAWKSNTNSYREATEFLTGRYATDTMYAHKLNELIDMYDLTQFDAPNSSIKESEDSDRFILPIADYCISNHYGSRETVNHRGLDFAAQANEPILASKAGTVIIAEEHPSWGKYVVIAHEDGMTTLYAHQNYFIVSVGQKVSQRQIIGYVGSTGNSTGNHLHFEVCQDNTLLSDRLIDPEAVLPPVN
ncbi:peptidoglycan DD-metalloendopeptidase family protein [Enterococcus faecium]|uniref:peptidoglycan DD-metalloendopeptidase family protein n=1 Tax=Enterococcus faecium TaxID=1352 RepID=UPI000A340ABE|nr:peptidoglycan DD-metalloendopeptidase family protein [Enterococcus faecium]OTO50606.1 hypothetical protein A5814_002774 [Enterococcus faecium]